MDIARDIMAITTIVDYLKSQIPEERQATTAVPVVVGSAEWLRGVATFYGRPEDELPAYIHTCPVVEREVAEPMLITDDEPPKIYRVRAVLEHTGPIQPTEIDDAVRQLIRAQRVTLAKLD